MSERSRTYSDDDDENGWDYIIPFSNFAAISGQPQALVLSIVFIFLFFVCYLFCHSICGRCEQLRTTEPDKLQ